MVRSLNTLRNTIHPLLEEPQRSLRIQRPPRRQRLTLRRRQRLTLRRKKKAAADQEASDAKLNKELKEAKEADEVYNKEQAEAVAADKKVKDAEEAVKKAAAGGDENAKKAAQENLQKTKTAAAKEQAEADEAKRARDKEQKEADEAKVENWKAHGSKVFQVGDIVSARARLHDADFPVFAGSTVLEVLPNNKYNVRFKDGGDPCVERIVDGCFLYMDPIESPEKDKNKHGACTCNLM